MWIYEHQMMYSVGNADTVVAPAWSAGFKQTDSQMLLLDNNKIELSPVWIWFPKMIQSEIGVIVFVTMTGGRSAFTRGEYMNPNDDISDWEWFRPAGGCCTEKGDP